MYSWLIFQHFDEKRLPEFSFYAEYMSIVHKYWEPVDNVKKGGQPGKGGSRHTYLRETIKPTPTFWNKHIFNQIIQLIVTHLITIMINLIFIWLKVN
jgi:hypothetical protein